MNNYCVALNLDLKIFNSDLHPIDAVKSLPEWNDSRFTSPRGNKHIRIPKDFINNECIDFFKNRGIHLIGVEVFYTVPRGSNIIHSDVLPLSDVAKINWVYGGVDSRMEWYTPNTEYNPEAIRTNVTKVNSPTLNFNKEEVDLVHTQAIESPSIVQAGCPHNMINGSTERFCISTIFASIETRNRLTMNQAKEIFKEFVVPCP